MKIRSFLCLVLYSVSLLHAEHTILSREDSDYVQGLAFIGQGNCVQAVPILRKVAQNKKSYGEARIYSAIAVARCDQMKNDGDRAQLLQLIYDKIDAEPRAYLDLYLYLSFYSRNTKPKYSLDSYKFAKMALKLDASDVSAKSNLTFASLTRAEILLGGKDKTGANSLLEEALTQAESLTQTTGIQPEFLADAHNSIGRVYFLKENYPSAAEAFREAIKVKPQAIYRKNLAWALLAQVKSATGCSEKLDLLKGAFEANRDFLANGGQDNLLETSINSVAKELARLERRCGTVKQSN